MSSISDFERKANSLRSDRNLTISGYTMVEEMAIINNFKKKLSLGRSLESAQNSVTGLDTWLIHRQSASGVRRFIESKLNDIAANVNAKRRKKLSKGESELLKKFSIGAKKPTHESPFDVWFDLAMTDKSLPELPKPDIMTSVTTSSRNSFYSKSSVSVESILSNPEKPIITAKLNRSGISLNVKDHLDNTDELIIRAAEKAHAVLDDIEKLEQEEDTASILTHAVKCEDAYNNLFEDGKLTEDNRKLEDWLKIIDKEYKGLCEEELSSLGRYDDEVPELKELKKHYSLKAPYSTDRVDLILSDIHNSIDDLENKHKRKLPTSAEFNAIENRLAEAETKDMKSSAPALTEERKMESEPSSDNAAQTEAVEAAAPNPRNTAEEAAQIEDTEQIKSYKNNIKQHNPIYDEVIQTPKDFDETEQIPIDCITWDMFKEELLMNFNVPKDWSYNKRCISRKNWERFNYFYKRASIIFGEYLRDCSLEDSSRSVRMNHQFIDCFSKITRGRLVYRKVKKNMFAVRDFYKTVFGDLYRVGNKKIRKYPKPPPQNIMLDDQHRLDKKIESLNRSIDKNREIEAYNESTRPKMEKTLEKINKKMSRIESKYELSNPIVKLNYKALSEDKKRLENRLNNKLRTEYYTEKDVDREKKMTTNPEWLDYWRTFESGSLNLLRLGWIIADVRMTAFQVEDNVDSLLERNRLFNNNTRFEVIDYFYHMEGKEFSGPHEHLSPTKLNMTVSTYKVRNTLPTTKKELSLSIYKNIDPLLSNKEARSLTRELKVDELLMYKIVNCLATFGYLSKRVYHTRKLHRNKIGEHINSILQMDLTNNDLIVAT